MNTIDLTNPIFNELHNCTFENIEIKKANNKIFQQKIISLISNFIRKASDGYLSRDEPTLLKTIKSIKYREGVHQELKLHCNQLIEHFENLKEEVVCKYTGYCHDICTKKTPIKTFIDGLMPKINAMIQCIDEKINYDNTFVSNRANYLSELEKLDTNYLYVWLSKTCDRTKQYSAFEHLWDADFDSITIIEKPNESNEYTYVFETKLGYNKSYFYARIYDKICFFRLSM